MFSNEGSDGGTLEAASFAMLGASIKFAGIWSGVSAVLRVDMENLARSTGSFRPDGVTPRVLDGVDSTVAPTDVPQVMEARLAVRGDGSPLDEGRLLFLVPPTIDFNDADDL